MTDIPAPAPMMQGDLDLPFREGCARHEFLVQQCGICQRHYWPASCCIEHGSGAMRWVTGTGAGVIETYTVFHYPYSRALAAEVPYTVAVVRLDDGPFYHSRIVDCPTDAVKSGMRVAVKFIADEAGAALAVFAPEQ